MLLSQMLYKTHVVQLHHSLFGICHSEARAYSYIKYTYPIWSSVKYKLVWRSTLRAWETASVRFLVK